MSGARRLLAAGIVAFTCVLVGAGPAAAHLAIRLDIRSPEDGAKVGRHVTLEIYAQPTLAGVDHTTFKIAVDGHPVDPVSGKPVSTLSDSSAAIPVSTTHRTPLNLSVGRHHVTVEYRPDIDEPVRQTAVDFEVRDTKHARWADALIAGAVMVAVATFVAVRRVRRAHP